MVLGFGAGKISLHMEKKEFTPPDIIKATAMLQMHKPVKARKAYVKLVAMEKRQQGKNSQWVAVYKLSRKLDIAREYRGIRQYEIECPVLEAIPKRLRESYKPEKVPTLFGFPLISKNRVKWYFQVGLDIPMGLDVKKRVSIKIL